MFEFQLEMDLSLSACLHAKLFLCPSSSELEPGQVQTSRPEGAGRFDGLLLIVPLSVRTRHRAAAIAKGMFLRNVFPPDPGGYFQFTKSNFIPVTAQHHKTQAIFPSTAKSENASENAALRFSAPSQTLAHSRRLCSQQPGSYRVPGENADSGDSIGKMVQSDDMFAESARLRRRGSQVTGNT